MIGSKLSHYHILQELGRGGMGIVYKARDTKLDRTVAIKVLPSAALASKDDRERFYREAKSAAQLHHPNIASVFEIDEAVPDGGDSAEPRPFIAMEFIAGGTLQDKIKEKPLSLSDAVKMASQVAEALKAAHAKNIVHRDIKSANVMITEDGIAKVLDFGLAKTNQSTMLTRMGSTLGTVAYMSPEQARGQEVDGRSDLYSLGTMLYEMIAGRLPFAGEYEQAVVYSILNEPPEPLTALRTGVPMDLERIVTKLMAKDADYRFQTATDLLVDLKSLDLSGGGLSRQSMPAMSEQAAGFSVGSSLSSATSTPKWMWGAFAVVLLLVAAGVWLLKPDPAPPPATVFSFPLELESRVDRTGRRSLAISPDGKFIAYVTSEGIRLRRTDDLARSSLLVDLSATTGAARDLFFSPDSRSLAFEDDQNARLMQVDLAGGSPSRIAELPGAMAGASWAATGDIYLGILGYGIGRISRGSGTVELVVAPDSTDMNFMKPSLLPDGRTLLYTRDRTDERGLPYGEVRLRHMESGEDRLVAAGATSAQYVNTGHIVMVESNTLYAIPYDAGANTWSNNKVPMTESVMTGLFGVAHFDVSKEGTLVILDVNTAGNTGGRMLSWISEDGTTTAATNEEKVWGWPDVTRDGTRIVVEDIPPEEGWDLWTLNVSTGIPVRLTSNGQSTNGVWSPDGLRIAHADYSGYILLRYLNDASRVDTLLHAFGQPTSWSADGRLLFFEASASASDSERTLQVLDLETGQARKFPASQSGERDGNISPDGRWLAYEKTGTGSPTQVYVLPFPSGRDPRLISAGPGADPRWSADGTRLYYAAPGFPGQLYSAKFDPETGAGQVPTLMHPAESQINIWDFAVHPDGRVLVPLPTDGAGEARSLLRLTIRFDEQLRSKAGN